MIFQGGPDPLSPSEPALAKDTHYISVGWDVSIKEVYFIPQGPTSALTSSRQDVKQLVFFQILQNADENLLFSDNSAVILSSKVC